MTKQSIIFWLLFEKGWLCLSQTWMRFRLAVPETPTGPDPRVPAGVMSLPVAEVAQDQAGNVESCKERSNFHLKVTT